MSQSRKPIQIKSYDFPAMLASFVSGPWLETEGPDSGTGLDYWYSNENGDRVYINLDQNHLSITLQDADGQHEECVFEGPDSDPDVSRFVSVKEQGTPRE